MRQFPTLGRFWRAASHPTRDGTLFVAGLVGISWQTLHEQVDRPYLLVVFSAMCGLPIFLNLDEKNPLRRKEPNDD